MARLIVEVYAHYKNNYHYNITILPSQYHSKLAKSTGSVDFKTIPIKTKHSICSYLITIMVLACFSFVCFSF